MAPRPNQKRQRHTAVHPVQGSHHSSLRRQILSLPSSSDLHGKMFLFVKEVEVGEK